MQNVMHIATNSGHTAQNDGQTMQNDGRTKCNVGRITLNVSQGPKGGLEEPPRAQGDPSTPHGSLQDRIGDTKCPTRFVNGFQYYLP